MTNFSGTFYRVPIAGTLLIIANLVLVSPAFAVGGSFTLERSGGDEWRARYCLERPVEAVKFERPVDDLRETHWKATDKEFSLHAEDGTAVLTRTDGEPFECGQVLARTWTHRPEKNYYAFSRFSDGGMSVYTGYFTGSALVDGKWESLALSANYLGLAHEKVITRDPDHLVEQFVYFGKQNVLESGNIRAVIDPAMPEEARQNILDTIPAVNKILAEEFAFRSSSPYLIFMATELESHSGFSSKGGALPNQVLFTLKGTQVDEYLSRNPKVFAKSAAHEIVHLWQLDRWQSLGSDEPWVHEGGADALAYEILRRAGIYDGNEYLSAWQEVEESCVAHLREVSIHSGPESGNFDVAYQCGALLNRLIGEALNPDDPGAGIIRLWRTMSDVSGKHENDVSEALFFRTLKKLHLEAEEMATVEEFLDLKADEPAKVIAHLRTSLD